MSKTFTPNPDKSSLLLTVLDSTDPGAVLFCAKNLELEKSLFIVSTKSGTTEETLSFFKYFYNLVSNSLDEQSAGEHFIAITDPGSKLVDIARTHHFLAVFLNDPNIGGRYSALSYFGLVPAAFLGMDLPRLLDRAEQTAQACTGIVPIHTNPAARLGAALGELVKTGRDKLTLILSPRIASFGDWLEQLIAESSGKEGRGILPVVGEMLDTPDGYGEDRVFVHIKIAGETAYQEEIAVLEAAGHPVIRITLRDLYELGGQFFLWELATAIAGYRLGINPFDQPNVEAAKIQARQRISAYKQSGELPSGNAVLESGGIAVFGDIVGMTPAHALADFVRQARTGDYIALQAFLQPTHESEAELQLLRHRLRGSTQLATTLGFGPRFLHSTGQLHKGDRGNGLFIQFTADDAHDVPIPDQAGLPDASVTFGILKMAQALGDQQALIDAGRRTVRFHMRGNIPRLIHSLVESLPG
jgi:hypothetical protein